MVTIVGAVVVVTLLEIVLRLMLFKIIYLSMFWELPLLHITTTPIVTNHIITHNTIHVAYRY